MHQTEESENEPLQNQPSMALDDGTGLRVVRASFDSEGKFSWDLFGGYDCLRVLTYSASAQTIVRMLDDFSFDTFECVFGYEGVLREIKSILAFQKVVVGETRAAIKGLKDERHIRILEMVHRGKAHFWVLRGHIAHAKIFLLSSEDGRTRVIVGSANLSEQAFGGNQPETLVVFDDDEAAWEHYNRMFESIRDSSSDEVPFDEERIINAEIEISDSPVMSSEGVLVIEPPSKSDMKLAVPAQIERVEKVAAVFDPRLAGTLPSVRNGKQTITPDVRRQISRISLVKSVEEANNRHFSINRERNAVLLSGKPFSLEWDGAQVDQDARLLLDYFGNFEGAFEGEIPRLQRDYFALMCWLFFSPFFCDLRTLALLQDSDVIRYPMFAIVFGKSNCGKTSLVDTLMTAMFGYAHTLDKRSFTAAQLRGLQHGYKRFPVVFDDISRSAFNRHGKDMIKDELQPGVAEHPGFVLSMNAEPQSFPDEIVKRCMMVYTTTALPAHAEELRQSLFSRVQEIRRGLSGHLYRRYLTEVMRRIDSDRLPEDWLSLSSEVLTGILTEGSVDPAPEWCRRLTWVDYAAKRYDRIKTRLANLLRPTAYVSAEGEAPSGWTVDGDTIIVWEPRDAFGRRGFHWEDVPSTLIDDDASSGNRTVLDRNRVEDFLGKRILNSRPWWKVWG